MNFFSDVLMVSMVDHFRYLYKVQMVDMQVLRFWVVRDWVMLAEGLVLVYQVIECILVLLGPLIMILLVGNVLRMMCLST